MAQPPRPSVVHCEDLKAQRYEKGETVFDLLGESRLRKLKHLASLDFAWQDKYDFCAQNMSGTLETLTPDNQMYVKQIKSEINVLLKVPEDEEEVVAER